MKLDIDQILEHIAPWDFSVKIGGETYATRRPSIAELGALSNVAGKTVDQLAELIGSLFVVPPPIRWELPVLMAFLGGFTEYFSATTQKKELSADVQTTADQMARQQVKAALSGSSSPPSSGQGLPVTG
jgi:hypothetical protein